jgi:hypothetical protein
MEMMYGGRYGTAMAALWHPDGGRMAIHNHIHIQSRSKRRIRLSKYICN